MFQFLTSIGWAKNLFPHKIIYGKIKEKFAQKKNSLDDVAQLSAEQQLNRTSIVGQKLMGEF